VAQFTTAIGRVVKGCTHTPVRGQRFCREHLTGTAEDKIEEEEKEQNEGHEAEAGEGNDDKIDELEGDEGEEIVDIAEARPAGAQGEIEKGKRRRVLPEETVAGTARNLEEAPLALRTRRGRKMVETENLYNVEYVVKSRWQNGVDGASAEFPNWILTVVLQPDVRLSRHCMQIAESNQLLFLSL
jgi:hypothetical protein